VNLKGKTAIVTGASSGLGAAVSVVLTLKGCHVFGIARSRDKLEIIRNQIGILFTPVSLDITSQTAVSAWAEDTITGTHQPDILINNAGVGYFAGVDELSSDKWHQMVQTNLDGVFYMTRKVVSMIKAKGTSSHIINIGSILGKTANAKQSAYSATKYAIRGFSEALFKELRYDGIKITCLNPGSIKTGFFRESGIHSHDNMMSPDAVAQTVIHVLETPENVLISDVTLRPLNPKKSR
jgi:NADP-dependent 3-hydroxy acid dehydrogenase YdfG